MSIAIIPYVILLAHPDYKGSYTEQIFGCGSLDEIKFQVLKEINYYVYQNIVAWYGLENNINIKVIEKLYNGNDIPYRMSETSWTAKAFINGKWENINPTYEEIVEMIIKNLKKYGDNLSEDEDISDNNEDVSGNNEDVSGNNEDVSDNNEYDNPSIYINQSEANALQNGPSNNIITSTNQIKIIKK
jgi:hypothetical protein